MPKIKVVHIHTDYKFVKNSKRFKNDYVDNIIVIFNKEERYNGPYKESAKFYNRDEVDKVVGLCRDADLVVLYNLGITKSRIVLDLPNEVKIAWRFFGTELYSRMGKRVLSKKTQSVLAGPYKTIKDSLRPIYHRMKFGAYLDTVFPKAIDRIDYMLVRCRREYEYLSKYFENLPEYLRFPIRKDLISGGSLNMNSKCKSKKIVVGNSRSNFNNHLDVLDKIEVSRSKKNYNFLLLFNYGSDGNYVKAVRKAVKGKFYYRLIEEIIPEEEFINFYSDINALIINSYRQLAMGNIFIALKNGVKVYLNKKNMILDWLLSEGIEVFPIAHLMTDIENDNIRLDEKTAHNNLESLNNLYLNYTEEKFQGIIYSKICKK